ncbi:MAG: transposase [Pseudonocardiales bacterium]|nr:transposase [Pseudonocardiales bacterium]
MRESSHWYWQGGSDVLYSDPRRDGFGATVAGGATLFHDDAVACGDGRPAGAAESDSGGDGGTSEYWKPVFYLLEANGFETWLVNARDVKHLPGRPKTDLLTELPGRCRGRDVRASAGLARFPGRDQRRGCIAGVVRAGGAAAWACASQPDGALRRAAQRPISAQGPHAGTPVHPRRAVRCVVRAAGFAS